jgi:hypothetical protein
MPSLIGNKPSQVPSNGDLGTLAFQDSNAVNITGGVVDVSAGTAALPTLGTTGDPNTGVFFPAADTVAVATNGAERVRIFASGGVSIGNTTDAGSTSLSVTGNITSASTITGTRLTANVSYTNTSDLGLVASANISGINLRTPSSGRFSIVQNYSAANLTQFLVGTGTNNPTTETLRLDGATGNVTVMNALNVSGLIYPQQAATAPTYVKGAIYFDTTLNKLRVGGATGWETITSV